MKLAVVVFVCVLTIAATALAGQKYNPMEDRFETVPDDYEMRYDPMDDEFLYQDPDAELEYNPMEDTFDWNPKPNSDKDG